MYRPTNKNLTCPNCQVDHILDVGHVGPHVSEVVDVDGNVSYEGFYHCGCGEDIRFNPDTMEVLPY